MKQTVTLGVCSTCKLPYYPADATFTQRLNAINTHECMAAIKQALNTAIPWWKQEQTA